MKTKECFTSGEIAHVWAHQKQESGRVSGGNQRFSGTAFYSYATVIANIITHKGKSAFVLDAASFSSTTSGHQGSVRHAVRDLGKVFTVHCGHRGQWLDFTPATLRDHYLTRFNEPASGCKHKAKAARELLARVGKLDAAIEVCEFFGLAKAKLVKTRLKFGPDCLVAAEFLTGYESKLKATRDLKWANRSAIEKAREEQRIASKIALAEGDLTKLDDLEFGCGWTGVSLDNWGADDHDLRTRPDLRAKVKAERERRAALTVADWLAGVPYAPRPDGPVVLRVDGDDVETSLGARVPLADAERAFRFAIAHRTKGWHRNGEQFEVGHYQLDAVRRGEEAGRGVFDMPPRAGKTRMMAELTRRLALPTIWIAPTDRIVTQTLGVLRGFFGDSYAVHLVGSKTQMEAAKVRIVVCTAATAANLSPEFYASRHVLVMDEFHHAGSKQGETIFKLCENIYYRFGMTGTFFRSGEDELAMRALLSNVIYKITSLELVQRKFLVPTQVVFIPVVAPRLRGLDTTFQTGHGKHGIHEHDGRNAMVANAAVDLWNAGKRVLVLVGTKEQGRRIKALIQPALPPAPSGAQFDTAEFCSTDMARPRIVGCIESFLANGACKVLIGTSLLGEGVDLPEADALVYARGEQAEVTLVQNAYRVSTALPGKSRALIVDFGDRHNRKLLAHSHERLAVYHSDPLFKLEVLGHPNEFGAWLKNNENKTPT